MLRLKPLLKRHPVSLELDDPILGEEDILGRLDEYGLYCHYLEFEPQFGVKYTSPVRVGDRDDRPSFGIYHTKYYKSVEYMWKDQGKGVHGDIFDLVRHLYQLDSRLQARLKIKGDFGLGPMMTAVKLPSYKPRFESSFKIRVKSRGWNRNDIDYWQQFNIDRPILDYYNVTPIGMYWTYDDQETPKFPRTPGYAYRIWDRYKIYFPHDNPDFKFRNDYDERHLEGFCQLQYNSDLLIITKALKDVMMLRSFGMEAVAPRGEHTMIPENFIGLFKQRYKHIVVIMDNDGKHKGPQYTTLYQLPFTQIPLSFGAKDPTDFCKLHGAVLTEQLIQNLVYEQTGVGSFIRSYLPR